MVIQRTYEILGSGVFFLTIDTPGVRRIGKPGRDFAVSASPADTVRLVNYYLKHPLARERIRRQGRRTVDRHNYTNRAKRMLAILRRTGLLK
ncbi:glycosyltransferase family protein [Paenibacillus tyrfis]|uniref:glycosyltransferase family protein n=1 Tax=Paenibacillus tyrfis TaxID=1501230 RepID=UPI0035CCD9EC